jgi:four helix bundle protein
MKLARAVYASSQGFPHAEQFGLCLQMRRCAVSIPSNIAEGAARGTSKEFAHYLSIALGSLAELDTQIELAQQPGFIAGHDAVKSQHESTAKLVTKLRPSIQARISDH